jgi:hypothetical protein
MAISFNSTKTNLVLNPSSPLPSHGRELGVGIGHSKIGSQYFVLDAYGAYGDGATSIEQQVARKCSNHS